MKIPIDNALAALAFFIPGLWVGSLLASITHRWPRRIGIVSRSDACPQFPRVIRLATAALWAIEGWRFDAFSGVSKHLSGGLVVAELIFICALVVTAAIDWEFMIIPDAVSIGGTAAGIICAALLPVLPPIPWLPAMPQRLASATSSLVGAVAGSAALYLLYWAGRFLFRAKIAQAQKEDPAIDSALGLGDVKLMGCFGAFLGWQSLFPIFLITVFSGAAGGILLKFASGTPGNATGPSALRNRWRTGRSHFPLGPFLALGALAVMLSRP